MNSKGYEGSEQGKFSRWWLVMVLMSSIAGIAFISVYGDRNGRRVERTVDGDRRLRFTIGRTIVNANISGEKARRRTPQAIIIGVKKGGTRALLEYLRMHPDVKAAGPEVHFFDRYYHLGADWYRRQMPATMSGQVAVEKTPSYFVTKEAPARLRMFDPNVKLIIVLRNPVTRAVSDYAQNAAKRRSMPSFEELAFVSSTEANSSCNSSIPIGGNVTVNSSWGAIRIGVYHRYIKRWLKYFDLKRVHFVNGEGLVSSPASETASVERFLGLRSLIDQSHFVYPNPTAINETESTRRFPCLRPKSTGKPPRCLGKTKGRRHPKVNRELLRILDDFYRPHNEKLYKLIGRRFDW